MRSNPLVQNRDGRRLLGAQLLDALASGVASVALPWLVLDNGGSAASAGLVFAASLGPYVLFGLPAGVTGDRRSRKAVMVVAHAYQAVAALAVPLWAIGGVPPAALVLAAAFAIGAARVYADAAAFGAIASIVGPSSFVHGQAALSTAWAVGFVAGPVVGGAVINLIGPVAALAVQAVAFSLSALLTLSIRRALAPPGARPDEGLRTAVREGIDVIVRTPLLRLLTVVSLLWNLFVVGAEALIVPYLRDGLDLSGGQAGAVLAAGGISGIVVGPLVGVFVERFGGLRLIAASIVGSALSCFALAAANGFVAAFLGFTLLSLAFWVAVTTMIGERQRHAPERLQARVGITGRMIAVTSMTVASLAASGLTALAPLRSLYVVFGVAALLVAAWAVPALLRAAGREPHAAASVPTGA